MVKSRSQVLISMLVGICSVVFLILLSLRLDGSGLTDDSVRQDQLFDVYIGDQHYPDTDLADFRFTPAPKGTVIRYSTVLKGEVERPLLRIYVIHSLVKLYLDEELIYTHGRTDGHLLGYGYLLIPLPEDYSGRVLSVEQTLGESGEMGNIRTPVIFESEHYYRQFLTSNRLILFTDTAIVMMALAIIIVGFVFIRRIPEAKNLMWMAAAFIGMSLWEFCNSNLIALFTENDLVLKGYMEYLSLYITPVFLLMYFADDLYHGRPKRDQAGFLLVLGVQLSFIVTALSLHYSDVRHLPGVLYVGHFVIILTLGYVLTMNIRSVIRRESAHRELLIGTVILALVALIDIVRYLVSKTVLKDYSDYSSLILLGMFAFMLCMILDFFNTQQRNILAEARSDALEKLAYNDIMTGLYNRRKIHEVTQEVSEEQGKRSFGILNFDLNDLKKANDNYGHAAGDRLLTDFSAILEEVFGAYGIVARMGGDEFIVFYRDTDQVDTEALMQRLEERVQAANGQGRDVPISYASGFSTVTEEEKEKLKVLPPEQCARILRGVYQRADDLMYEDKARIKKNREQTDQ